MSSNRDRERISPWANPTRRALRQGKVCIGACSISFPCAAVAQIAAEAGFSFYYFDMEHSNVPIQDVESICNAAKLTGITPIAGTTGIADFLVSRPLDCGAMGVIVPHVNTADQTRMIVSASRYVPKGTRGLLDYGILTEFKQVNPVDWVEAMNREILVAVKVESANGIENIEEIAAVPGLDAILIGTGDLSASYEIPGQTNHPVVRTAVDRMLAACKRNGIAGGPHVSTAAAAGEWADRGATFMSCGLDGALLLEASKRLADGIHDLLGDRLQQSVCQREIALKGDTNGNVQTDYQSAGHLGPERLIGSTRAVADRPGIDPGGKPGRQGDGDCAIGRPPHFHRSLGVYSGNV